MKNLGAGFLPRPCPPRQRKSYISDFSFIVELLLWPSINYEEKANGLSYFILSVAVSLSIAASLIYPARVYRHALRNAPEWSLQGRKAGERHSAEQSTKTYTQNIFKAVIKIPWNGVISKLFAIWCHTLNLPSVEIGRWNNWRQQKHTRCRLWVNASY